jgi:mRNA interferase RelE/StbE
MEYQIRFSPVAKKRLAKISQKDRRRILSASAIIKNNPFIGKKLCGKLKNSYAYRVWPYRIIYKIYKTELLIIIIRIAHRQGAYK